jgi:hypothetical protein
MKQLISFTILVLFSVSAFAASDDDVSEVIKDKSKAEKSDKGDRDKSDISDILDSMGYPELQVVPRASERLALEAKSEDTSYLVTHWPIELSALGILYIGMTDKSHQRSDLTAKEQKDAKTIASATEAVGAGWLIGSLIIGAERPYRSATRSLSKYTGKDERSTLLRERLAEEALEKPARTMHILQNLAVITMAGVSVASAIHANETGCVYAGVGVLMALFPLMFEDHNISVYDKHIEYKKKIYAPLKSASFKYDPLTHSVTPLKTLTWMF